METMKSIANKHGLACLLHEKPFAEMSTEAETQQLVDCNRHGRKPARAGRDPYENAQFFLLFLTAVLKAVNEYQDLLRVSVRKRRNDHRLGANEGASANRFNVSRRGAYRTA